MVTLAYTNRDVNSLTVEGEYEPRGKMWILLRWRISYDHTQRKGERVVGNWYKVHGNQRKDIGALKLVLDSLPAMASNLTITFHD